MKIRKLTLTYYYCLNHKPYSSVANSLNNVAYGKNEPKSGHVHLPVMYLYFTPI